VVLVLTSLELPVPGDLVFNKPTLEKMWPADSSDQRIAADCGGLWRIVAERSQKVYV
jgi:hypothetical protein